MTFGKCSTGTFEPSCRYKKGERLEKGVSVVICMHLPMPKLSLIPWCILLFLFLEGFKVGVEKKETLRKSVVGVMRVCLCEILNAPPTREFPFTFYTLMQLCNGCVTGGVWCCKIRSFGSLRWTFIPMGSYQYVPKVVAQHDN